MGTANDWPNKLQHLVVREGSFRAKDGAKVAFREATIYTQETNAEFEFLEIEVVGVKYPKTFRLQVRFAMNTWTNVPGRDYYDEPALEPVRVITLFTGSVGEFDAEFDQVRQAVGTKIRELEDKLLSDDTRPDEIFDGWVQS